MIEDVEIVLYWAIERFRQFTADLVWAKGWIHVHGWPNEM